MNINIKSLGMFLVGLLAFFVFLLIVKVFDISYPLSIVNTTRSTELSVVGEGKVESTPDIASADVGVTVANAATVEEVQKTIDKTNNDIIAAMKKLGIQKADIKTSNYSIYPNYSYEGNVNQVSGYNGNVNITIKIKNINIVSTVIEEATKAGANQISGVTFSVDKPEKYREMAREKAIQNAKEQAQKLAANLGIKLGKIVNIVESTPENYALDYSKSLSMAGGAGGGPAVEPGTQTITSTVTLYFEKR